jgi:uncharacterized protein YdaU (DUF1376 family)
VNYYERHIGDYLKDTAHLSLLEHGIYTRLLDVYYTRESGIPVAEVARLIGARSRDEKEALQAVLAEFFVLDADRWTQARCESEIARYQDKQRKAKAAADARWSESGRNANAFPSADAQAMRTHSEGNATREHRGARAPTRPQSPDTRPHSEAELPQRRRGSRLPDDWQPADESGVIRELALQPGNVVAELRKFRDFWASKPGKDGTKLDWQATWRNWLRSAAERLPRGTAAPAESFRERDERLSREKFDFLTGRTPANTIPPQGDFIEAEVHDVTPRQLG